MSFPDPIRPIPGCPGYLVSAGGAVYSCRQSGGSCGAKIGKRWRRLKAGPNRCGYARVRVAGRVRMVHQLIAATFLGPCPEGLQVRHLDGDKANNSVSNLVYGTALENHADMTRHGRRACGERSGNAKLTEAQVREILHLYAQGVGSYRLGKQFKVNARTVRKICRGERWRTILR